MASKQKKGGSDMRSIIMDVKLWTKLRMQSLKEHRSASDIIRELVRAYLEKKGG